MYIYIYINVCRAGTCGWRQRWLKEKYGDDFLRRLGADSSSPLFPAILVGRCTAGNYSLRKSPRSSANNFQKSCAERYQNPGLRNSLYGGVYFVLMIMKLQ